LRDDSGRDSDEPIVRTLFLFDFYRPAYFMVNKVYFMLEIFLLLHYMTIGDGCTREGPWRRQQVSRYVDQH